MTQITLNEEQLKALNDYLQEMPMKYAAPIVEFINNIIVAQNEQQSKENIKDEKIN